MPASGSGAAEASRTSSSAEDSDVPGSTSEAVRHLPASFDWVAAALCRRSVRFRNPFAILRSHVRKRLRKRFASILPLAHRRGWNELYSVIEGT